MIRIKDIAKKAGVSPTTVSNVIHGNQKKVSPDTQATILALLKEMNYVPSMGARMLAGERSHIIGVLVGETPAANRTVESDAFTSLLLHSLEQALYARNYYMLLHFSTSPEEGIQFVSTWNVDGVLTLGISEKDNRKLQSRCPMPLVSIDVYYKESGVANVGLADRQGGYLMACHLIETGHQKICFLADNDVGVDHQRWLGVKTAWLDCHMEEASLGHLRIPKAMTAREKHYGQTLKQLAQDYDALFFASDFYAAEAMAHLTDAGISVPEEISVAGFDDNDFARLARPRLTTVRQEVPEKALHAVNKLLAFINGQKDIPMEDCLPVKLVIRDSTRKRL